MVSADQLQVLAKNSSALSQANNDVNSVAAALSASGASFAYTDKNSVDIGTAGTTSGITTNAGDITVTALGTGNVTLSKNATTGGTTGTVTLDAFAGGAVTETTGAVIADKLLVKAVNTSALNTATNDVNTVAAVVTGAKQSFSYTDATSVDVGTVGGTVGITTKFDPAGKTNNTTASKVSITGSTITISGGITSDQVVLTTAPTGKIDTLKKLTGLVTVYQASVAGDSSIAALTINTNSPVGDVNNATSNALHVDFVNGGLVVLNANSSAQQGAVVMVGPIKPEAPVYQYAGNSNYRTVIYNGQDPQSFKINGALDASYLEFRNISRELRESGFAKDNAARILRNGLITRAGEGEPVLNSAALHRVAGCPGTSDAGGNMGCEQ